MLGTLRLFGVMLAEQPSSSVLSRFKLHDQLSALLVQNPISALAALYDVGRSEQVLHRTSNKFSSLGRQRQAKLLTQKLQSSQNSICANLQRDAGKTINGMRPRKTVMGFCPRARHSKRSYVSLEIPKQS